MQSGICLRLLTLERLKKFCSRLERGFLSSGEASATEHSIRFAVHFFYCAVFRSDLRRSRNDARSQKDRSFCRVPNGYRISLTALLLTGAAGAAFCQTNKVERPLSLAQCFRMALGHNFDIRIARFNPEIQQHNLSATYGAYEPTSSFIATRSFSASPSALNTLGEPVTGPTSYADSFTPGIIGLLPSGMNYNLGGNLTGVSETGPGVPITKRQRLNVSPTLSQPILRNLWIDSPREVIQVNKKLLKISKLAVTQQIMATLTSVELAYDNLIVAQEQVKVYEEASRLAQRLVDESKLRVIAGSQASLDEKQAESQLAASQATLIGFQGSLLAQEYTLENLLTDKLPEWDGVQIKPT